MGNIPPTPILARMHHPILPQPIITPVSDPLETYSSLAQRAVETIYDQSALLSLLLTLHPQKLTAYQFLFGAGRGYIIKPTWNDETVDGCLDVNVTLRLRGADTPPPNTPVLHSFLQCEGNGGTPVMEADLILFRVKKYSPIGPYRRENSLTQLIFVEDSNEEGRGYGYSRVVDWNEADGALPETWVCDFEFSEEEVAMVNSISVPCLANGEVVQHDETVENELSIAEGGRQVKDAPPKSTKTTAVKAGITQAKHAKGGKESGSKATKAIAKRTRTGRQKAVNKALEEEETTEDAVMAEVVSDGEESKPAGDVEASVVINTTARAESVSLEHGNHNKPTGKSASQDRDIIKAAKALANKKGAASDTKKSQPSGQPASQERESIMEAAKALAKNRKSPSVEDSKQSKSKNEAAIEDDKHSKSPSQSFSQETIFVAPKVLAKAKDDNKQSKSSSEASRERESIFEAAKALAKAKGDSKQNKSSSESASQERESIFEAAKALAKASPKPPVDAVATATKKYLASNSSNGHVEADGDSNDQDANDVKDSSSPKKADRSLEKSKKGSAKKRANAEKETKSISKQKADNSTKSTGLPVASPSKLVSDIEVAPNQSPNKDTADNKKKASKQKADKTNTSSKIDSSQKKSSKQSADNGLPPKGSPKKKSQPHETDFTVPSKPAKGLPEGWDQRTIPRSKGNGKGDTYYYSPVTNLRLRSKNEAQQLIAKLKEAGDDEAKAWKLVQEDRRTKNKKAKKSSEENVSEEDDANKEGKVEKKSVRTKEDKPANHDDKTEAEDKAEKKKKKKRKNENDSAVKKKSKAT